MDTASPIGRPLPRVDGPLKVSGTAAYTADHHFPRLLFAVPVPATITSGAVERIDTSVARAMPGVCAIYTRATLGQYFRATPVPDFSVQIDEQRLPFEDDVYSGRGHECLLYGVSAPPPHICSVFARSRGHHKDGSQC
jgi:xanthine dehydrogenase YagR molybdenum-binding subunit